TLVGAAGITTSGSAANAVFAQGGGQVIGEGGWTVETKGDNARGVLATGTGSSVELASTKVSTAGIDARGLSAVSGGALTIDGLADVTTAGARGHAVLAGDTGTGNVGTVRLGSVRTQTSGSQGHGLYAINAGSRIDVTGDATLTVGGPSSIGIVAELGGVVAVGGKTTIDHTSADGYGILAQNSGSLVALQSADIQTAQAGRLGMYIADGASVTATRMDVRTAGASADGIVANGGTLAVSGPLNISVAGSGTNVCNGGVAICLGGNKASVSGGSASGSSLVEATGTVLRFQTGTDLTATLDNTTLRSTAAAGDLISVDQATGASSLTLKNSTATAGGSNLLLNVATGSTFAFDNDRTTLTGDIKASADSTVNMTLTNGSFLTGRIDPVNLTIDASSRWDVTGDSVLGTLSHAGTLNMLPGAGGLGGTYKTVTVGNYVGNGGRINLNTYLGTDNSPSDKLVIDGGTASGSTTLGITNAGGGGAPTSGKGIQVVQATGGATTATSAFSLAAPVSAGAYDYSLVRNVDESWYLTSAVVAPPP
ncbi:MAG TPA: autotransporter outer membrane beta-barrel domain-containing protein, partial [Burkholderiaceae bacterium]|nr:autotransporter outer membrane beta-barrel domain-containing protein [Burkholderiaceae bacterium]